MLYKEPKIDIIIFISYYSSSEYDEGLCTIDVRKDFFL